MNRKMDKGITLIALVITIIVLLILAGVTINMVLGDEGIIAQARQAKNKQAQAEIDEQNDLKEKNAQIESYKEGTAANLAKKGELKQGAIVKYTYTSDEYNIPTEKIEKAEHTHAEDAPVANVEKFNSGTTNIIEKWRVLSTEGGIIKLIPHQDEVEDGSGNIKLPKLTICGENGWLNGSNVLNEMCKTLYSGDYGKARSITLEDIEESSKWERVLALEEEEIKAVSDNYPLPKGINVNDIELNFIESTPDEWDVGTENEKLFFNQAPLKDFKYNCWIGTRTVSVKDKEFLSFRQYMLIHAEEDEPPYVGSRHLWNGKQGEQECNGNNNRYVLPVVELNAGLKVEKNDSGEWEIK